MQPQAILASSGLRYTEVDGTEVTWLARAAGFYSQNGISIIVAAFRLFLGDADRDSRPGDIGLQRAWSKQNDSVAVTGFPVFLCVTVLWLVETLKYGLVVLKPLGMEHRL